MTDATPLFRGEARLLRWGESSSAGRTITLELEDGPDASKEHPFKGLPTGAQHGQRLLITAMVINDDETLGSGRTDSLRADKPSTDSPPGQAPERIPAAPTPKKPKTTAQRAGILCDDAVFHDWLATAHLERWVAALQNAASHEKAAAIFVREHCGVLSRGELDTQPTARKRFETLEAEFKVAVGRMAPRERRSA